MASHTFQQFALSIEKRVVKLWAAVAVGAAGAVTLQAWNPITKAYQAAGTSGFRGIKSVARTGTGAWTVTLDDTYQRILGVEATSFSTSGQPNAPVLGILSSSNVSAPAAPVVNLQFMNASASDAGAVSDPSSGETIILEITLQDSTAP